MIKYKVYTEVYDAKYGVTLQLYCECVSLQELNIAISTLKNEGYIGEIKVIKEVVESIIVDEKTGEITIKMYWKKWGLLPSLLI